MSATDVRRLTVEEIEGLGSLFLEEQEVADKIDFWQDRGDDFLKVYRHHMVGVPTFWGAYSEGALVGCTGLIPTAVSNPFCDVTLLDTDIFVSPRSRSLTGTMRMVHIRNTDYLKDGTYPLQFGIEHKPGSLQVCHRITRHYGGYFDFPFQSMLTEVFLTSPARSQSSNLEVTSLSKLSNEIRSQWLELFTTSRSEMFLSPRLQMESFEKILEFDPDCEAILNIERGELLAGALLINPSRGRKLICSDRRTLVKARLEKEHGHRLNQGSEFRMALVSLSVCRGPGLLHNVFEEVVRRARGRGFHCISFRDEDATDLEELSPDVFHFPRRVFLTYGPRVKGRAELESRVEREKLKTRFDAAFV